MEKPFSNFSKIGPLLRKKIPILRHMLTKIRVPRIHISYIIIVILLISFLLLSRFFTSYKNASEKEISKTSQQNSTLLSELKDTQKKYEGLKNTDQLKRNNALEDTIKKIQSTYGSIISVYENMLDLPASTKDLSKYHERFAKILKYLKDQNYASGSAELATLQSDITTAQAAYTASIAGVPDLTSLPSNNAPPGSGYSRQRVDVNGESFAVDLIAGSLSSTRVIVDTASDSTCTNNCPVLSLGDYVARNGAYAGVNGSYFCPADYPSCAGKTNSFDTLAMNKNKHYLNGDNNVYSTVPAVIFGNGFIRFVGQSLSWGRDTGVDGVLANQPLLVSGGTVVFGGDGDPKKGSKGNRSFVANKGNTVYIGVAHNVTVAESALVMKALGMDNALNLDSGGSTALWVNGGYKDGPGRNLPNVILFVNK